MIDFWFKSNDTTTDAFGIDYPRWPDSWVFACGSFFRKDDGTWVARLYLAHDTWDITIPSYGEHLSDTGAATSIANSSEKDWTAEEVNASFQCHYASTHYEPSDV